MSEEMSAATWEEITSLTPWSQNPRFNENAVSKVAASIERFGFASPIVARSSDRVIIAGHTRLLAAQQLGMDKVPVRFMDLEPDQAAALALADNKLGEVADWNEDLLADVLNDLNSKDLQLDDLGWNNEELETLLKTADVPQETGDWEEFDGDIGEGAPSGKTVTCPHCKGQFTV